LLTICLPRTSILLNRQDYRRECFLCLEFSFSLWEIFYSGKPPKYQPLEGRLSFLSAAFKMFCLSLVFCAFSLVVDFFLFILLRIL
jgi:hypothetical protein